MSYAVESNTFLNVSEIRSRPLLQYVDALNTDCQRIGETKCIALSPSDFELWSNFDLRSS